MIKILKYKVVNLEIITIIENRVEEVIWRVVWISIMLKLIMKTVI